MRDRGAGSWPILRHAAVEIHALRHDGREEEGEAYHALLESRRGANMQTVSCFRFEMTKYCRFKRRQNSFGAPSKVTERCTLSPRDRTPLFPPRIFEIADLRTRGLLRSCRTAVTPLART